MTYWITRLSGDAQSDNRVVVSQNIANSARQLGFKEINYNLYDVYRLSSQEYRNSLLDGLISGVKEDDIVFMSYPMWILNWAFQQEFIDRVKLKNAKIVAFILDLPTWLETKAYDIETDGFLEQLRTFDLIISQNERFSQRLRDEKVNTKTINLDIYDFIYGGTLQPKVFKKEIYIVSGRPVNLTNYVGKTKINVIGDNFGLENFENVNALGRVDANQIPAMITGGFGAVDIINNASTNRETENRQYDWDSYSKINSPSKLATYLASGLPVMVPSDTAHSEWIKEKGLGLVVDDLNDIDGILENFTEEDYEKMLNNVHIWQWALSTGFSAKRALMEATAYLELGLE